MQKGNSYLDQCKGLLHKDVRGVDDRVNLSVM